jgi:hypothetical protein
MSFYTDLFNSNVIDNVESLNAISGTFDSITCTSSNITNGTYQTLFVGVCTSDTINVKNLNFHTNCNITKGEYKYELQNKSGVIAFLDDIKTPENMVTTDTEQTISGLKTFSNNVIFGSNLNLSTNSLIYSGTNSFSFQTKSGVISLTSDVDDVKTVLSGVKDDLQDVKDDLKNYALQSELEEVKLDIDDVKDELKNYALKSALEEVKTDVDNTISDLSDVKSDVDDIKSNYVDKTTNQTIGGLKTFQSMAIFSNGISNGTNNFTFSNKNGRLLIDDDIKDMVVSDDLDNLNSTMIETVDCKVTNKLTCKDELVTGLFDCWGNGTFNNNLIVANDIRFGKDGTISKVANVTPLGPWIYSFPEKSGTIVLDDDIKDMVVQDDIKDMVVIDDLKNYVTLNTNQDITAVKSFENTVYFNGNVYVKYDKKVQTGDLKCLYDAEIDGTTTTDTLIVDNDIKYNGVVESSKGNLKTVYKYYYIGPGVVKYLTLNFTGSGWWTFGAKLNMTGWVDTNPATYFMLDYVLMGAKNFSYGSAHDEKLVSNYNNNSHYPILSFNEMNDNRIAYAIITDSLSSYTTWIATIEVNFVCANNTLVVGFETKST